MPDDRRARPAGRRRVPGSRRRPGRQPRAPDLLLPPLHICR